MPIRFRCVYCDKLLGIARRKAGTIINCPHCAEKLIVPTPDPADTAPEPEDDAGQGSTTEKALAGPSPPLFEKFDIDALLHDKPTIRSRGERPSLDSPKWEPILPENGPRPSLLYPPSPAQAALSTPATVIPPMPHPSGFYVSPAKATVLTLSVLVLLGLAFGGGWMVGRSMSPAASRAAARAPQDGAGKTAQDYFDRLIHEQWAAAYEMLDPETRAWCSADEFSKRAKTYLTMLDFAPAEVKIMATEKGDDASIIADIRGPGSKHLKDSASLRRTASGWRVTLRKNFGQGPEKTS